MARKSLRTASYEHTPRSGGEKLLVSFQHATFEQAKAAYKPLKRGRMSNTPSRGLKTSSSVPSTQNNVAKKRAKKAKKLTDGQLKKRAWKEFSIFIRTEGADKDGFNQCVTCYATKHWKELQAGHFIRGRLNANLFDERGVAPQCYSCNVGKQGEVVIYYKWMLANYGQAVIDELILQNNTTRKWMPGELQSLWNHYKALNASNPLTKKQE